MIKLRTSHIVATLTAAVTLTGALSARAADFRLPQHRGSYSKSFGNGNFGAALSWYGYETGSSINADRSSAANSYFGVSGSVFGKTMQAINLNSMSGSVDAYAQVSPFWRPSTNLISWGAPLVYNSTIVDDTATYSN
jgi:hypothetical protein